MQPVYLDHNATTPVLPEVSQALADAYSRGFANPLSQHEPGRRARRALEEARQGIESLLGASTAGMQPDRLILTSGGAESNFIALRSQATNAKDVRRLVISSIEHPSIAAPARKAEAQGTKVVRLPVDGQGRVELDHLADCIGPDTSLVSVMLANNETGVLQPLREIVSLCEPLGVPVHTDATQVVGKLPIDFHELGVAMLSFAAHKFHGPSGVGGLLVRGDSPLAQTHYYDQTTPARPGSPAVEPALGMLCALQVWREQHESRLERMTQLRDRLEEGVLAGDPQAQVIGRESDRLPHTSCLAFVGLDRQAMQMALDRQGVACSTGSACASGSSEPSPTLLAMGLPEEVVRGALRFSLGATTTGGEIEQAISRILTVSEHLRKSREP